MSNPDFDKAQLLDSMPLLVETDVVLCRNRARMIAESLGFERQQQVRIATAVSEIARNAFRYAKNASARFSLNTATAFPRQQGLLTTITDTGAGISDLDSVLNGTYQSRTGMGAGIRGAKRLMDVMELETSGSGTTVRLLQNLPPGRSVDKSTIQKLTAGLPKLAEASPIEALADQNREVFETLEQITVQKSELEQINEELSETNRGVVALYDELDTVHRVGRVIASKLDLQSLLSAITDATTEISDAEFGAFFQIAPGTDTLVCKSIAGLLSSGLEKLPAPKISDLVPDARDDVFRVDDLCTPATPDPLGIGVKIGSLLACPVRDTALELIGVLVFGHTRAGVFTERTERILATVATQASIGIENARLYKDVQSANEAKDRFLAILSHELRTPLNPVFAVLAVLEEHSGLPQDVRSDLLIMRRNLELEARLIDDLLDLTRIAEGKMPLAFEPNSIHELVERVCGICRNEAEKGQINVSVEFLAEQQFVRADAGRLQQVFWNLLNNAIKFTPTKGKITLRTANTSPGFITFSIADSGRGIEAHLIDRVFNPFEQGGSDVASRFGGLGLGLAISKSIVDAHGGEIRVESEGVDQGTTFYVSLPTIKVGPATPDPAAKRAPQKTASLKILLVDDHEDTRFLIGRILSVRGHDITEAGSVAEALAAYRIKEFDLLISDLGLPDGSGHELMVAFQKQRPLKGIVLSGYGMETDVAMSKAAGFDQHLTKPIDIDRLDEAISRVVDELL